MLPILVGIEGSMLSSRELELFTRWQPAGYILFSRNIIDHELCRELCDDLQSLSEHHAIIAIDQEGGRVVRTADIGLNLPSASALAATKDAHQISIAAHYTARMLLDLGVNCNLAPVLDAGSSRSNALPDRCWGSESQAITSYAGIWNRELQRNGVRSCGKHFPGMGGACSDPHFELPILKGSREDFLSEAAIPFTALMPELPSIMMAHILLPDIDTELPSSLSPSIVQQLLRNQLGYEGLVMTDDLCMGAISTLYSPAQSAAMALLAGCDLPLLCHEVVQHLDAVAKSIESLPEHVLDSACERIERYSMLCETAPPMPFIAWRDFQRSCAAFHTSISPTQSVRAAASPVESY